MSVNSGRNEVKWLTMAEVTFNYENGSRKEVKWLKHYSSNHEILLVGEGDFSFSLSLAIAFGSAFNILATSLDTYDKVIKKYKKAKTNMEILEGFGAQLLYGVDAIKQKHHPDLQMRNFDRIVYNFPHAGFLGRETDDRVIMKHRSLVHGFLKNASRMLLPSGEVHVSHKTTGPFQLWDIEELAYDNSLRLLECVEFWIEDYPNYENKRGDGKRSDDPFPLGECSTFKFILSSRAKKSSRHRNRHQPREISSERVNASTVMNPNSVMNSPECFRIFREYFDHERSTFGHSDDCLSYSVPQMLRFGFERCKAANHVNPLNDYINHLKELQYLSKQRIAFLRNRLLEINHHYSL